MAFAREAVIPFITLVFVAVYVWMTQGLPPESSVFPYTVMIVLGVLGLAILLTELRVKGDVQSEQAQAPRTMRAPLIFTLSVAFVLALLYVHFVLASFVFLLAAFLYLRGRPFSSVAIAAGFTAAIYLLFSVALGVRL